MFETVQPEELLLLPKNSKKVFERIGVYYTKYQINYLHKLLLG